MGFIKKFKEEFKQYWEAENEEPKETSFIQSVVWLGCYFSLVSTVFAVLWNTFAPSMFLLPKVGFWKMVNFVLFVWVMGIHIKTAVR